MDFKNKKRHIIGRFVLEVSIDYNNKNRQAKKIQKMLSGKDKGRRRIPTRYASGERHASNG
jgi:hypothetical protein